ncbi:MAG TPA: hypothetical protein VK437_17100 [Steroidobacteraceae bacterium]|nr:hypothetical protein [Steroidobacteraceae bacterium]
MIARLAPVGLLILALSWTQAARASHDKPVDVHAYINDSCLIADEPFFMPVTKNADGSDQMTPKFLPLLGIVVGKLAELFLNHEVQGQVNRIKSGAGRKDTRYATTNEMNLYRIDLQASPVLAINGKLGCMTIVAAKLKPPGTDCTSAYVPKELDRATLSLPQNEWKTTRTDDSVENQLRRANVCVDGTALAVYEARFEFSKDGTAYRLKDAGYRINSLLTTEEKGANRAVLYTLKIFQPGATDQSELLSSAWVKIGTVSAGARSSGAPADSQPWLRVPALSAEARRAYEEKTKTHQELSGEIDALKRAIARNQRIIQGLDQRIASASASADIVQGLKDERTKTAVQVQVQEAELDARNEEFRALPHAALEFMPVEIEVAVTETESEKKAQLALADIVGTTGGAVASEIGNEVSGAMSKSLQVSDIVPDNRTSDSELARLRARYFDALIEVQSGTSGGPSADSQKNLTIAKAEYNEARRSLGLDPIQ